jgi:hypothetical protein
MYFEDFKKHQEAQLNKALLWEFDLTGIDYEAMRASIVQRVIERGRHSDWHFILNLYGVNKVKEIIKELPYLSDKDRCFVSHQFSIPLTKMKCYERKQLPAQHWNS